MGGCSCENLGGKKPRKCDQCMMDEMRSLGLDPVSVGRRQVKRQTIRIVRVRCPGCGGERDIIPGNARRGLGMKCQPCAYREQVGKPKIYKRKPCSDCGEVFRPTHPQHRQCDDCMLKELREMGHDAIGIRYGRDYLRVVCRCAGCRVKKPVIIYDLKRVRLNRPWRCNRCAPKMARHLTKDSESA
jgi:hypothetical protein